MAWVISLRSVSSMTVPGRTCPSGRWLAVLREVAFAATNAWLACPTAAVAAGSTVDCPWLAGWPAQAAAALIASDRSVCASVRSVRAALTAARVRALAGLGTGRSGSSGWSP